jgi:hypothetical protein
LFALFPNRSQAKLSYKNLTSIPTSFTFLIMLKVEISNLSLPNCWVVSLNACLQHTSHVCAQVIFLPPTKTLQEGSLPTT